MKLTDAKVRSLKAKTNRYEVWETGRSGFGLRVSASSNKSWFYFYRFEGKNRRMTLGVYPVYFTGCLDGGGGEFEG
jgi:hypothetical protein